MNPTENKLENILNNVDDELKPIDGSTDSKSTELETKPKQEPDTSGATDPNATTGTVPSAGGEEEGYTAEDVKTEEEAQENETPQAPALDAETQYIADNLPSITTRIKDGDDVKEVTVKSWTQLPQDVEFASKRDELAFMNALTAQENRAVQLQNEFRNNQNQRQAEEFETRENAGIRNDITSLQNAGDLPKFKVQPDDPKFADDPATKEVQEVLDFMNDRNQKYLENYNNGAAYRHIGFAEAYSMMPKTQQKETQKEALKQEDTERRQVRVGGNTGTQPQSLQKSTVPRGTTLDQIVERIEQTW